MPNPIHEIHMFYFKTTLLCIGLIVGSGVAGSDHGEDIGSAETSRSYTVQSGIAATSHADGALATAVTTAFQILPSPWKGSNLGSPALAGSYGYDSSNGSWTVRGAGTDMWYISDQGFYLQQPFTGEGRLVARVKSLVNTAPGAKAGLMIRSSLDAGSANVFMGISAAEGATFQRRTANGGITSSTKQAGLIAPRWVKLEARNGFLIGSQSANGTAWTEVGRISATFPFAMGGLAVTSHNAGQLTTAVFDKVDIQSGFPDLVVTNVFDTAITGNGDRFFNPGEEFGLVAELANHGTATAKGVTARLSTSLSCLTLVDTSASYGDFAPGYATSPPPSFRIRASTGCPAGTTELNLVLTDAYGDRWERSVPLEIVVDITVRGTVRTPAGPPPLETSVVCHSPSFFSGSGVGTNGEYDIENLVPGEYTCWASAPGYPNTPEIKVTVPPSRTGVDFLLSHALVKVDPTSFAETLKSGQSRAVSVKVSNPGDAPLNFKAFNLQTGYVWRDSDAPGGPVFSWNDIKATGTRLSMTDGLSGSVALKTLGFAFPTYGNTYRNLVIDQGGFVSFSDYTRFVSENSRLPIPGLPPKNMIAGFWDDLGLNGSQGGIYFQDFGDRAVIQYDHIPRNFGSGTYTFQIVLHRDGMIRFYYKSMQGPTDNATVGIQNAIGDRAVNVVTDAPYVKDNLAVEITPTAKDWLTVSPVSGTIGPGSSQSLSVTLDATGLFAGPYKSELILTHNDFGIDHPLNLPVQMTVQGSAEGVLREVWTGIVGSTLAPLLHLSAFPDSPNLTDTLPGFESPRNYADNFGEKLSAYITPPVTGDYTFWIAGDDQSELRLSPDEFQGNAVLIARTPSYTTYRNWDGWPEQRSSAIRLTAGRKYYIEALHKEGLREDHLSVGWQGPGITGDSERPIPGTRLIPFDPESGLVSRNSAE